MRARALLVVPTYNEGRTIAPLLEKVLALRPALDVLVVDDGSADGTARVAAAFVRRTKGRVRLLARGHKLGLGSAYVDGFRWGLARPYSVLAQMDGDLSHDPAALPALLAALQDADVAVGSRYLGGKVSVVHWPLGRLALSMAANAYVRAVTGLRLSDCTSGFKAWRRTALEALDLGSLRSDGYAFQVEMSYKAWRCACRLAEVPIVFTERADGTSKLDAAVVREAVWRVWALRLGF